MLRTRTFLNKYPINFRIYTDNFDALWCYMDNMCDEQLFRFCKLLEDFRIFLKTNYVLICFDIFYVVKIPPKFFCINASEILEYTKTILMLFGVTWASDMSSHFSFVHF